MRSTLALSTSIPLLEMMWPRTIPYFTIKWHFSQFKTKFFSIHLYRTSVKWCKHWLNESPKTEKSSIKTSRNCSTISEKMLNIGFMHWEIFIQKFVTICSHDVMLLAGNVLSHERALSFKENGNNLSLTSLSEKFSYLNVWQITWKSFRWLYGSSFSKP